MPGRILSSMLKRVAYECLDIDVESAAVPFGVSRSEIPRSWCEDFVNL